MREYIDKNLSKEILDDVFGYLVSQNGGWRPSLMSVYIDMVVKRLYKPEYDGVLFRKEIIRKMKELEPVLFRRV